MVNDFICKIIDLFVRFLTPALDKLTPVIEQVNTWIDTYVPVVMTWYKGITYFIPVGHITVFLGVVTVILIVRVILAIYDQIAQIIP